MAGWVGWRVAGWGIGEQRLQKWQDEVVLGVSLTCSKLQPAVPAGAGGSQFEIARKIGSLVTAPGASVLTRSSSFRGKWHVYRAAPNTMLLSAYNRSWSQACDSALEFPRNSA